MACRDLDSCGRVIPVATEQNSFDEWGVEWSLRGVGMIAKQCPDSVGILLSRRQKPRPNVRRWSGNDEWLSFRGDGVPG